MITAKRAAELAKRAKAKPRISKPKKQTEEQKNLNWERNFQEDLLKKVPEWLIQCEKEILKRAKRKCRSVVVRFIEFEDPSRVNDTIMVTGIDGTQRRLERRYTERLCAPAIMALTKALKKRRFKVDTEDFSIIERVTEVQYVTNFDWADNATQDKNWIDHFWLSIKIKW